MRLLLRLESGQNDRAIRYILFRQSPYFCPHRALHGPQSERHLQDANFQTASKGESSIMGEYKIRPYVRGSVRGTQVFAPEHPPIHVDL
ncbi:MAG: hypothetical protein BECKG1743E_GA0114224_107691 [Candidatus Kentron sp. G]|nr:MAG: hypothetical protein BECKG1743E_GA0114224_107691 [Candidatus Kentron sp. G]